MTDEIKKEETTEEQQTQEAVSTEAAQKEAEEKEVQETADEETQTSEEAEAAHQAENGQIPSFSGEPSDKVYSLDELEQQSIDYQDDEYDELVEMYEGTLSSITEKEIVTGRVVSKDDKYVIVDIGFKSEGIVPLNEFRDNETIEPGDEIEVFLDKVEDREGQLVLSRKKADTLRTWQMIEEYHENEKVIEGYIKRRIKGGMVVDINGIDAFLPGSQIDVRPVRDFDAYVGRTMEFMVVKLNLSSENVVVSHRALVESDLEEQREQILASMEPGQILEGIVKNITDFGVFIDLGGVDGLLHITDLSWGRVEHPSEIVRLDQKLNVVVLEYDEERKRISLGLKQLQPHPWDEIDKKYPEKERVQGKVVSIADYGAFIELEKGVEGLVHISEMSWTQHIKHPSQLVEKNEVIECVVLNINKDEKKVSLGVKQLQEDPWENLLDRFPIGSKHTGVVRNLTNFGVFVELEPGIDGLVHISDLSWTEKINHPSEVVNKGDELEVSILSVDFDNRRISLGHKQIEDNPWEKFAIEYARGNEVTGEVTRTTEKGVFVKLPLGVEAFMPAKEVAQEGDHQQNYNEADEIKAVVIEFDETSKNITLSEAQVGTLKDEEKKSKQTKKSKKKSSTSASESSGAMTLGEMSGLEDLKQQLQDKEEASVKKEEEKDSEEEAKKEEEKETKSKSKSKAQSKKSESTKAEDSDSEETETGKTEAKAEEDSKSEEDSTEDTDSSEESEEKK